MNKTVLTAAAALVAGAAIYMSLPDRTTDMPAVDTAAPVAPGTTQDTMPTPAETVEETAAETAEQAAEVAPDAAQQATEAARDIAEEAATALNRAVQEATTAADTAAGALAEAAREALDSATGAGAASPEASGQALAAIAASAGMTEADVEAVLSVEGFDHDRAAAVIAASDLGDLRKTLLTTALAQAQGNPELLQLALDQTRGALGL
ncbi:MAG: hypothetical protein NWQ32_11425 [Paracoccaceae bacterium]|nr:hypothetical protein [Paracoccaceae bacterium]